MVATIPNPGWLIIGYHVDRLGSVDLDCEHDIYFERNENYRGTSGQVDYVFLVLGHYYARSHY
jgi:hypothetical protein